MMPKPDLTRPPAPELPREILFRRRAQLVDELQRLQQTRRPSRRSLYVIVAALVLLAIAAPALGLDDRLRHFVAGEPAPAPVKEVFGRRLPGSAIVERAHGVMAITSRSRHRVLLWVAPTRLGGRCSFLQVEGDESRASPDPNGSLACETRQGLQARARPVITPERELERLPDGTELQLLFGSVSRASGIRTLELRIPVRAPLLLRLVRGFFLAEWPAGARAGTLVGRGAGGAVLARRPLPPLRLAGIRGLPTSALRIRARADYGGHEWYMFTVRRGDLFCVGARLGGPQEQGCKPGPPERFREGPIELYGPGASQDPGNSTGTWDRVWFYGFVSPAVWRLVLLSSNCSREPLPIQEGAFLHLARGEELRDGVVPSLVIAYGAGGEEIGRARLRLIPAGRPESEARRHLPLPSCAAGKNAPR